MAPMRDVWALVVRLLNGEPRGRLRLTVSVLLAIFASGCSVALMGVSAWLLSRAAEHPPVAGHRVEPVVAHLGQHRVHHDEQADGDGERDPLHLDRGQRLPEPRHQPAEHEPREHREADPHRQEAVKGGQVSRLVGTGGCRVARRGCGGHEQQA